MEPRVVAGALLLVVPLLAWVLVAHPALFPVWSAERERHLAIVGAHRTAWRFLNAGFAIATVSTVAGLGALVGVAGTDPGVTAALVAVTAGYAVAGGLWCAIVAVRARTTPLLADLVAGGKATEPAEATLGAAVGGLFDAAALATPIVLVLLCATLALAGAVALPVAVLGGLVAAASLAGQLIRGDSVPAVWYVPTQLIGLALLAGWT
jgi:hypothetical protein